VCYIVYSEVKNVAEINPKSIYDRQTAAALMGVVPHTLDKWRRRGLLPYRKAGGKVFFMGEDLLKLLEPRNKVL
jgi:predicted site-specific integrase-resolvase